MRKILFMLAAIMFAACGDVDLGLTHKVELKNPYAVTPDEAVQLLQTVIGGESTRSISVSDIKTLSKSDFVPTTRSASDGEVIYIVDIEGGGSAILGADKRMEPIYAVLDKTKISAEDLVTSYETRSGEGSEDIGDYILGLLNNAIVTDMQDVEPAGVEMPIIPRDETWRVETVTARRATMLNTKWDQVTPYNLLCPLKLSGSFSYAGCGPIAAAQIMYYNRFPSNISVNGETLTINWNAIAACEYGYNPPYDNMMVLADLIHRIGVKMGVDYNLNDTNMEDVPPTINTPEQAETFFETIGYSNVSLVGYTLPQVIDMVYNKQLPVYMSGHYYDASQSSSLPGHAWVIDGCNVYTVDYWVRHYTSEISYTEYIETTRSYNLVHCNYGWSGKCDGYYTNGIFDTTDYLTSDRIDSANGDVQYEGEHYYDRTLQLITYSLNN